MRNAKLIFWDFDGVIKDSNEAKTNAFITLFELYGEALVALVKNHHEANGGMSRIEKIPLYMKWAGEKITQSRIQDFQDQFSKLVFQAVINSPWVPGAQHFLQSNLYQQILQNNDGVILIQFQFLLVLVLRLVSRQQISQMESCRVILYIVGIHHKSPVD